MPSERPYSSKQVDELEALFEQYADNKAGLRRLADELEYRTKPRATKLLVQVEKRLKSLSKGGTKSEPDSLRLPLSIPTEQEVVVQLAPPIEPPSPPFFAPTAPEPLPPLGGSTWVVPPDLGELPTFPVPAGWNEPRSVLRSWGVLEVLSPQTFHRPEDLAAGDRRRVADLASGMPPWQTAEKSRPNYQLYYEVVLGAIPMDRAMDALLAVYGQDDERGRRERERAAIASFLVTRDGLLLDDGGVAVSSFAWGLHYALSEELGKLGNWPLVEPKLLAGLRSILNRTDGQGRKLPVSLEAIQDAYRWLETQLQR